jgi:hypothetical protein
MMGLEGVLALLTSVPSAIRLAIASRRVLAARLSSIDPREAGHRIRPIRKEHPMDWKSYRIAAGALLGVILAIAVSTAWAQRVDFERETHFRCYIVSQQTTQAATPVRLTDQFLQTVPLEVDEPLQFCAPTSKDGLPIEKPEEHLTMYGAAANLTPHLIIETQDQFGPRTLEAVGARVLLVPTQKLTVDGVPTGLDFPRRLNHSWCYAVNGAPVNRDVTLTDQFRTDTLRVEQPTLFCNPVEKRVGREVTRIVEREVHLTCYDLHGPQRTEATQVGILNQFEEDTFTITAFELLCVPSEKTGVSPAP